MEKIRLRLATTHLDRHNERFTVSALRTMVEQSNDGIIPLGYEHDPRVAPIGRIIKTELIKLEDGEYAVEGIAEIFDKNLAGLTDVGNREIPIRTYTKGNFKVVTDRSYQDVESEKDIKELQAILKNAEIESEIKKSFDPISILMLGGAFILGGIANGFVGEIGADVYQALKEKLKSIFNKPITEGQEQLFIFDATVTNTAGKSINAEVIITNPTNGDIQGFFDEAIQRLDTVLPKYFREENTYAKIVFEYKTGHLDVKFTVLKTGIPIHPDQMTIGGDESPENLTP